MSVTLAEIVQAFESAATEDQGRFKAMLATSSSLVDQFFACPASDLPSIRDILGVPKGGPLSWAARVADSLGHAAKLERLKADPRNCISQLSDLATVYSEVLELAMHSEVDMAELQTRLAGQVASLRATWAGLPEGKRTLLAGILSRVITP